MQSNSRATLIGSVSVVLWGTLALLTSLTGGKIPPFQLMAMSFAIAFLLMCFNWWRKGSLGLKHLRQPAAAWLIGVGGYFLYHFCYFLAMSKAPAVEVSLLAYLWPLLIVLFSAMLPGESLLLRHLIGALLALTGCWVLLGSGGASFNPSYLEGYLLAGACALIWSSYSVLSRLVKSVPTDAVGWFCALTAFLAFICHLLLETWVTPSDWIAWVGVIGLGLGPVGFAFFTWDHGVKHGNIQLLGTLAYGAPLISTLLLVAFGEGEASTALFTACALIISGSLLAGLKPRKTGVQQLKTEAEPS